MIALTRTDTSLVGQWWWTIDRWTVAAVAVLIGFGGLPLRTRLESVVVNGISHCVEILYWDDLRYIMAGSADVASSGGEAVEMLSDVAGDFLGGTKGEHAADIDIPVQGDAVAVTLFDRVDILQVAARFERMDDGEAHFDKLINELVDDAVDMKADGFALVLDHLGCLTKLGIFEFFGDLLGDHGAHRGSEQDGELESVDGIAERQFQFLKTVVLNTCLKCVNEIGVEL